MPMTTATALIQLEGIGKRFPGTEALADVSFELLPGEVHALLGANGAGKSTLIKIISGVYAPDQGTIRIGGALQHIRSPHHAHQLGIATIFQDINLVPDLTAAENLSLGREATLGQSPFLQRGEAQRRARELFDRLGMTIDEAVKVRQLSLAEQQVVAIGRALALDARVLILDEPTAVLSRADAERLFALIRRLKEEGVGIIYISHQLEESLEIADRATILRDGALVATMPLAGRTTGELVELIVGRQMGAMFPEIAPPQDELALEVDDLCGEGKFANVSFQVRRGEILCITGLIGSGKEEVGRALFGDLPDRRGQTRVHGRAVSLPTAHVAIGHGIGYAPADRKEQGLILYQSVSENMFLPSLKRFTASGMLWPWRLGKAAQHFVDLLGIKTNSVGTEVQFLSGGNQQKVVLAKWIATESDILVLVEPTNGLDVGAKADVYRAIRDLAQSGAAIVMISSELPEVLGMGHRSLVMRGGAIVAEFDREEATQEALLNAAVSSGALEAVS